MKGKKAISLLLSVLALSNVAMLAACGDESEEEKRSTLNLEVYEAGFGTSWLEEIASSYQAATGTKVKVNKSYLYGEIEMKLSSDQSTSDVVFFVGNGFNAQELNMFVDLKDVLESTAQGDTKTIKEKMNENIYGHLATENGSIYQLPWANTVSSLCYNETMLNATLGAGQWKVPNTTEELFALCEKVDDKGEYAFVCSTKTGYAGYLFSTWWAQYSGYDAYYDFFDGYYYKDGVRTFAENGETYEDPGRLASLNVVERLLKKSNGYTHDKSDRMDFTEAQVAFVGQGYGSDKTKVAMMVNGDWLENEVAGYLQAAASVGDPQTIKMMKMPVISSIVETLENKTMTDDTLSKVVAAIDAGATSYDGVSEKDFKKIAAARNMTYSLTYDHPFGIPTNSRKQDKAKDFIKYMLSDYGQSIYAKHLNGLSMPFGYQAESTTVSTFVQSRLDCYDNSYRPIANDYSSILLRRGGIGIVKTTSGYVDGDLFKGVTGQTIFNDSVSYYQANWESYLKGAGLK